jgi:hypothetical protein
LFTWLVTGLMGETFLLALSSEEGIREWLVLLGWCCWNSWVAGSVRLTVVGVQVRVAAEETLRAGE